MGSRERLSVVSGRSGERAIGYGVTWTLNFSVAGGFTP